MEPENQDLGSKLGRSLAKTNSHVKGVICIMQSLPCITVMEPPVQYNILQPYIRTLESGKQILKQRDLECTAMVPRAVAGIANNITSQENI